MDYNIKTTIIAVIISTFIGFLIGYSGVEREQKKAHDYIVKNTMQQLQFTVDAKNAIAYEREQCEKRIDMILR